MTDLSTFQRIATAAVGALVISTAFVAAAVGPAHAVGAGPSAGYAAVQVSAPAQAQA